MTDLSILIPARNEMFLKRTVEDILEHIEMDTEIIVMLDGAWAEPPLRDDPRVTIVHHYESRGQRAATNEAAKLARGKYVMKCDAHCAFDQGFDRIMLEDMQDDWTMVPAMRNLHVFDWVCQDCGHRRYQDKSGPCPACGGKEEREIVWIAKTNPCSTAMLFDTDLKFGYWREFKKRQRTSFHVENKPHLVETLSLLGACWLLMKDKYFELNICDEAHGSWGQQGTEVACKTWLSGGRLICNTHTWFAHMFRTKGGDFGFPYPLQGGQVSGARRLSKELFIEGKWKGAKHPLSWLIQKFAPVPGWEDEKEKGAVVRVADLDADLMVCSDTDTDHVGVPVVCPNNEPVLPELCPTGAPVADSEVKGIVYYTDNRLNPEIMRACQNQLCKVGLPIVSVSLEPIDFGHNIVVDGERGAETMFHQILTGLEACDADIVFFAEHDVLYHPSHFEFMPTDPDLFYYNQNSWNVAYPSGRALFHYSNHTSGLCAFRELLLEHYRKRVQLVAERGFSRKMGYEPGTHGRAERVDDHKHEVFMSEHPNLDLRHDDDPHGGNLTRSRWSKDKFRNKRFTTGWQESDSVPWWGKLTDGRLTAILEAIIQGDDDGMS